ncbi:alpha/beta hydrolase family protein [Paenibacillus alkalitolerans]|uniref:alpha/beta hydrolase family protein n=1 Tax=Paenibacillus alkalitolerans TaxID=2799335 RepID=UPI0018F7076C|nr:prolyl oligopeptidase family serine peptidase [Paenibacillus alkalitolerans]
MILHVTYLSDGYKVKGYLGVPPQATRWTAASLQANIEAHCGAAPLPVTVVAESVRQNVKSDAPRRLPALIYCRGGIGNVGKVRTHWIESFASRGFVVFAPSYRGNEGGEGRDEFGGDDREDVTAAFRLLRALPFVDSRRVSVMGFSRGAINAALTAAETSVVNRLILWGGVADLARTYEERVDLRRLLKRIIGGSPAKRPEAYQARSPLWLADRLSCPVLIVHGTKDVQVNVGHGLSMYRRLQDLGVPTDLHLYEGYGHHLPYLVHEAAIDRMYDWIDGRP